MSSPHPQPDEWGQAGENSSPPTVNATGGIRVLPAALPLTYRTTSPPHGRSSAGREPPDQQDSTPGFRDFSANSYRWAAILATVLVLLAVTVMVSGVRWFRVETPSMGESAPPGTLVIVEKTRLANLSVGDVITFKPSATSATYTHRVAKVVPGGLRTQGDINAELDPWTVTEPMLVGKVTQRLWGMGWIIQAAPWVLLGWVALWLITGMVTSQRNRSNVRVLGACFVVSVVALWLRPYVRAGLLAQIPQGDGGMLAKVVATGALPITVNAEHGDSVQLRPGQVGMVHSTQAQENGLHQFMPTLDLTGWWLVGAAVVCLTPVMYVLWRDARRAIQRRAATRAAAAHAQQATAPIAVAPQAPGQPRRALRVGAWRGGPLLARAPLSIATRVRCGPAVLVAAAMGALALVGVTLQPAVTQSAITATVTHPTNKAGTKAYSNCEVVMTSTGPLQPWRAYRMGRTGDNWVQNYTVEAEMRQSIAQSTTAQYRAGFYKNRNPQIGTGPCLNDTNNTAVNTSNNWMHLDREMETSENKMGDKSGACTSCDADVFPVSVAGWFKLAPGDGGGAIAAFVDVTEAYDPWLLDYFIYVGEDGRLRHAVSGSSNKYIESTGTYDDNQWHHFAFTDDGTKRSLYADSVLIGSAPHTGLVWGFSEGWWRFGASTRSTNTLSKYNGLTKYNFTGWIAQMGIWTKGLSASQVRALYEAAK